MIGDMLSEKPAETGGMGVSDLSLSSKFCCLLLFNLVRFVVLFVLILLLSILNFF